MSSGSQNDSFCSYWVVVLTVVILPRTEGLCTSRFTVVSREAKGQQASALQDYGNFRCNFKYMRGSSKFFKAVSGEPVPVP